MNHTLFWSRQTCRLVFGLVTGVLLLAGTLPTYAATLTVTNTNDNGPGSLRAAINAANPGDTIRFASHVRGAITLTGGELPIFKNLTIHGPGASQLAIDGNHASRVFNIYSGTVVLSGLTIQNGNADNGGGIAYTYGSTLTVSNCTVTGNSATNGGGLYDAAGSIVTVINSTITGNSAVDGGGLYNLGRLTLTNSKVSGNSSSDNRGGGGGIYSYGGSTLTLTNSTVSDNSASNGGGGIYGFNFSTITLTDSTVSGNSATNGGGILNDSTTTVTNSTVAGNSASNGNGGGVLSTGKLTLTDSTVANNSAGTGGGVYNGGGTITLVHSTMAGNSATTGSGGIDSRTGILRIKSTLLAGNSGGNCGLGGAPGSQGYNVSDDDSCSSVFTNTGDLNNVPPGAGLDPNGLQNNGGPTQTIALLSGSPALDHVPVANCTDLAGNPIAIDQRGIGRPQGPACDSGAFELASSGAILTVTSTGNSGHGSLRKAIAAANPGDTILFSITGTITLTGGELLINKNLTITGPGASQLAIDGNHADRVFEIGSGATVTISRLTIQNGNAPFNGGGILNRGTLTLMNSTVSGNSDGSGIYNNGKLTLTDSTISGNSSVANAGGLYNDMGGTATLTNSTVSGNSAATNGGGLYSYGGTLTLTDSTVSGNSVAAGGGIYSGGTLTLTSSTVTDNTATTDNGGGLYNSGGQATLTDSTVSGNSADTLGGGGFYNYIGGLTLLNTTIWRNSASTSGGGLLNLGGTVTLINSTMAGNSASSGGGFSHDNPFGDYYITLTIKNTLLAGNSGGNCGGSAKRSSQGYNISDDDSCTATFTVAGDLNNVPSGAGLDSRGLRNNGGPTPTVALLPTSPAVDHVPVANCTDPKGNPITTDQRGITRPQGPACDVGAFELVPTGAIFTVTNTNDNGPGSLRNAIATAGVGDTVQLNTTGTITLTSGELLIAKNLTITGPGASQLAIDGDRADRVFEIGSGATVAISGLTIKNGNASFNGRGISNGGTLTLTDITVSDNLGIGIGNNGTLTLINSTVTNNAGVGLFNSGGTLTLTNSTVSGNSGGGISNNSTDFIPFTAANLTLTNSTVTNNGGTGIFNLGSTVTLTGSTVSGNTANSYGGGGGIYNVGDASTGMAAMLTLTNSTVAGNSAGYGGGGIYNNFASKATLINSTIAGNSATYGGGLYNEPYNSTLTIKNTLLAGNSGENCHGAKGVSQGYNVSDDDSCSSVFTNTGDLNNVPPGAGLDPNGLQNNGGPTRTIALLPTSPAVDLIPVANCTDAQGNPIATDQRGITRPQGPACDVGAFELVPSAPLAFNEKR